MRPTSLYLEKHGYHCDCVRSGEDAAVALEKTPYDLLIIDINMPGNRNLEFLKSRPEDAGFLPVIVVTGNPSFNSAVESLRLSVVDYRVKPLDLPNFVEAVKTSLDKAKVIRAMRAARQGFGGWLDQISQMESAFLASTPDSAARPGSPGSLDWYLNETIQRFANLSVSLMNTVQTLKEGLPAGKTDVCSLMHCSRLAAYEDAMRETVDALIRTKNSFKSKELAEVRKKLECILKRKPAAGE